MTRKIWTAPALFSPHPEISLIHRPENRMPFDWGMIKMVLEVYNLLMGFL